jgi:uncharacterized protein
MKIEQEVQVAAPTRLVWEFFDDVPAVARCMPGASLTKIVDDRTYEGVVAMKVGPIAVNYQGTVVIEEKDAASRTVRMHASGKDRKGAGSAKARILATLDEISPDTTKVVVSTDLQLTGRVASLGRGVQEVAAKVFAEFADRVSAELTAAYRTSPGDPAHDRTPSARAQAAPHAPAAAARGQAPSDVSVAPAAPAAGRSPETTVPDAPIRVGRLLAALLREKLARFFGRLRRSR